ncbi:MAG: ABC transporter permease subunit [Burkholderiales bacterium]|nr:ABC transporter permease subunit [Burkholderiales bacterium]
MNPRMNPWRELWQAFARNRGALIGLFVVLLAAMLGLLAGWIAPDDPLAQHRDELLRPPMWAAGGHARYILGTDELGRDILSRLIHGARISLFIAGMSVLLAVLPGVALGLFAAYWRAVVGPIVMRAMDILLALPGILLAICVIAILGPGLFNTMIAIAIGSLPGTTRLARAAALAELGKDYVVASRVAGAGPWRLMFISVLPNCGGPVIVNATLGFSSAILEVAALGFLGLGVQAPTPEWGTMLSSARDSIHVAPWVMLMPGLAILVTVLAVNLMGDGLRDALDPKLRAVS